MEVWYTVLCIKKTFGVEKQLKYTANVSYFFYLL